MNSLARLRGSDFNGSEFVGVAPRNAAFAQNPQSIKSTYDVYVAKQEIILLSQIYVSEINFAVFRKLKSTHIHWKLSIRHFVLCVLDPPIIQKIGQGVEGKEASTNPISTPTGKQILLPRAVRCKIIGGAGNRTSLDSHYDSVPSMTGGAESGAQRRPTISLPSDLEELVTAWAHLPETIKTGILAMVRAARE